MIPLYKPFFPKGSRKYARDALDSGWVSWHGKYNQLAVDKLKELFGFKHVLLTSSGTAAVHLMAMVWLAFKFEELWFPENCYVGAINPFACRPEGFGWGNQRTLRSYPLDYATWNGSPPRTESIPEAVLIVHNLGNVFNVPKHFQGVERTSIFEDACEALGGKYYNQYVGTASLCTAFSFYASKSVTTGEGGVFVCRDSEIYFLAKRWATQSQGDSPYKHTDIGFNYRMSNVQAGLLLGQLENWEEIQNRKAEIRSRYIMNLKNCTPQGKENDTTHSNWMHGVRIRGSKGYEKAKVFFDHAEIEIRPFFYPLNKHIHLKMVPTYNQYDAERFSDEIILLPSYPELALEEKDKLDYIIEKVDEYANYCKRQS
jgi:perosamine synthetase